MKRKLLQLAHAVPDPLPVAAAVVIVLVLSGWARAALAQGAGELNVSAIHFLRAGEPAACVNANGCVAMTIEAYRAAIMEAISRGARTCNRSDI